MKAKVKNNMDKNTIDDLIRNYIYVSEQEDQLKERKNTIKKLIIENLEGERKYENDFALVQISSSERVKYRDEIIAIDLLKSEGYSRYVIEKIDSSFNKIIKDNKAKIVEDLNANNLIDKTFVESLTVKQK